MIKFKPLRIYRIEDAQGRQVLQYLDERKYLQAKENYQTRYEWTKDHRYFVGSIEWKEEV